jgi:hypothetical protein
MPGGNVANESEPVVEAEEFYRCGGQFISEDSVFLGDPSQQNLKDPQSLNGCI